MDKGSKAFDPLSISNLQEVLVRDFPASLYEAFPEPAPDVRENREVERHDVRRPRRNFKLRQIIIVERLKGLFRLEAAVVVRADADFAAFLGASAPDLGVDFCRLGAVPAGAHSQPHSAAAV